MKRIALGLVAFVLALAPVRAQVPTVWPAPQGANTIPLEVSTTFTTSASSVTLAAAAGKTTYVCGMVITSTSTSPGTVTATITGLVNTLNFQYAFVSSGQGLLGWAIPNCLPASALNTAIVISVPAGPAGTVGAISAWGYQN